MRTRLAAAIVAAISVVALTAVYNLSPKPVSGAAAAAWAKSCGSNAHYGDLNVAVDPSSLRDHTRSSGLATNAPDGGGLIPNESYTIEIYPVHDQVSPTMVQWGHSVWDNSLGQTVVSKVQAVLVSFVDSDGKLVRQSNLKGVATGAWSFNPKAHEILDGELIGRVQICWNASENNLVS